MLSVCGSSQGERLAWQAAVRRLDLVMHQVCESLDCSQPPCLSTCVSPMKPCCHKLDDGCTDLKCQHADCLSMVVMLSMLCCVMVKTKPLDGVCASAAGLHLHLADVEQ